MCPANKFCNSQRRKKVKYETPEGHRSVFHKYLTVMCPANKFCNSQRRQKVKYGHESGGTQNQELLLTRPGSNLPDRSTDGT
jgi:hypothetical protein